MRGETKELCYRIIQPTGKYKKHSLKSTNLINYTSSDKYTLGATLTQYNLTINYLEPIINLQLPLTQTHSKTLLSPNVLEPLEITYLQSTPQRTAIALPA